MSLRVAAMASADPLSPELLQELETRYLVFDAFVAGRRRVGLHPLLLPVPLHRDAARAAVETVRASLAASERAHQDPSEQARYRLHPDVVALATASRRGGSSALLARVDLLLGEDGHFVACEVNADCPGGHNESLALPALTRAAGYRSGHDPTCVVDALAERLAQASAGLPVALLYATAYAEDLQVCALIKKALAARGVAAVLAAPTAARLVGRSLFVGRTAVRAIYRFFPTEWLVGQHNVRDLVRAVEMGSVFDLTAFAHIHAQSKFVLSRVAPAPWIAPTLALEDVDLTTILEEQATWVLKRSFGRVGDQVYVGSLLSPPAFAQALRAAAAGSLRGESWVLQRFVPQRPIPTPFGPRLVTLGAYVLDDTFVGYFARLTVHSHVSHDALCVPVLVEAA
ncbi:MAG: glutathionylspermidine synthase family protein [Myxococcales bacterium]|nr:glutathionylspermidine synthase family protein [Myxococcales bacterium]